MSIVYSKIMVSSCICNLITFHIDKISIERAIIKYMYIIVSVLIAEKPNYEIGSSAKLSFAKKVDTTTTSAKVLDVWKIDNYDEEIIDPDDLLDEEDKVKPDPTSLKGTHTFPLNYELNLK